MELINTFTFDAIQILYYKNSLGGCEWIIIPLEMNSKVSIPERQKFDSLIQVKLQQDDYPKGFVTGCSMRNSATTKSLQFDNQIVELEHNVTRIVTALKDVHGNYYDHILIVEKEAQVFETYTVFRNCTNKNQTLEYLSSFSMSCLSPFNQKNIPQNLELVRYRSKWSFEGRKEKRYIEEYQLEPSWKPSGVGLEKFGQVGSMPVRGFFPTASIVDNHNDVAWGVRLANPGSWQMEAYRLDEDLCLSGGLADADYGAWWKTIKPREMFETPHAFLTVSRGNEIDCANNFNLFFSKKASLKNHQSEEDMAIMFNEFCSTWGNPNEEGILATLPILKQLGIDYYVIDAGWYSSNNKGWEKNMGDWVPNANQFPNGIQFVFDKINQAGLTSGIWFEIEIVGRDSLAFSFEDHLLKKLGIPITTGDRRFWDMTDPWVVDYLSEKVIEFLRKNNIEYIKIDYNDNFGIGCDGGESFGEQSRKKLNGSLEFFEKIHKELPRVIIENCSSGGHRLESSFLCRSDLSSFSDAHESTSIPIIAANLHELTSPRQNLIWVVIRAEDDLKIMNYSLTAGFLGRLCFSGDLEKLTNSQIKGIKRGIEFYNKISAIIKFGKSIRVGEPIMSYRYPEGSQAVVRHSVNKQEILLVAHSFSKPQGLEVPIDANYELIDTFGERLTIIREPKKIRIIFSDSFQGAAFHFVKKME